MPIFDRKQICCHGRNHSAQKKASFSVPGTPKQYPPDLRLEPIHLDIDLHVDLQKEEARGQVTHTLLARQAGSHSLELDAVSFEDVEVHAPESMPAADWNYDGKKLTIKWKQAFTAGEERKVTIHYSILQPSGGLYFSQPDEAYPNRPWFAATDHETERARHWLPCIDLPNVRTALDFHLRAESRFTILANGYHVSEEQHEDQTKTVHWRLEQRCPSYLVCFAIGEFTEFQDGEFEGIPVAAYSSTEHPEASLRRSFGKTKAILKWMTNKLGADFPYPKYFQFALPDISGAMENISLVSWDDIFVLDEKLAEEWTWLVDIINVHEMAHSYFGDLIVCRDFAHAWLKESWATYMEQCWLEDELNVDEMAYNFYDNATRYFEEADDSYKRPIVTREFKSSWEMYDRHLYPGGACRLHTLRHELGDELFWKGVQQYIEIYAGKVVETDDFRRVLEDVSGRSLVQFFDQWIYTPGYPSLQVEFAYDDDKKTGTFTIEQTQAKDEKEPAFMLSTSLGWTTPDGESHTQAIHVEKAKQSFTISMDEEPKQVRFDPKTEVLHKLNFNPGKEKLREQLFHAKDVIGRILAGQELLKTGQKENLLAVVEAYQKEAFWGVRVEWAKALSKAFTEEALKGLIKCLQFEKDPMVLESLINALGAFRDQRVAKELEAKLGEGLPYRATAAAYRVLGKQRKYAPGELLVTQSQQATYLDIAQSGALQGLAESRHEKAGEQLLQAIEYGNSGFRARSAGIRALASIGELVDKKQQEAIRERFVDLLRDPVPRIRRTAAEGLKTIKATQHIDALEAYRRTLPHQEQVELEYIIKSLQQGGSNKVASLEKEFSSLQEKYRKLEERLQKLEDQSEE